MLSCLHELPAKEPPQVSREFESPLRPLLLNWWFRLSAKILGAIAAGSLCEPGRIQTLLGQNQKIIQIYSDCNSCVNRFRFLCAALSACQGADVAFSFEQEAQLRGLHSWVAREIGGRGLLRFRFHKGRGEVRGGSFILVVPPVDTCHCQAQHVAGICSSVFILFGCWFSSCAEFVYLPFFLGLDRSNGLRYTCCSIVPAWRWHFARQTSCLWSWTLLKAWEQNAAGNFSVEFLWSAILVLLHGE